jgi:ketosteroid isomerase-like protein
MINCRAIRWINLRTAFNKHPGLFRSLGINLRESMKLNIRQPALVIFLIASITSALGQPSAPGNLKRNANPKAAIRAVLDAQRDAWNRGDIEGYMDGYDRSPKTEFVGGDSISHGWQTVLDRYKSKYDSREKMGTLSFSEIEITLLSKDAALVLGRWRLKRASDEPHGTFTLLFRRKRVGWRIVHDHSSSA